jgi:hypothetical protein
MTSSASGKRSAEPSIVAAHYEALRRAALGEVLPPEARSGLVLFLRRGMWGWAQALAAANAPEQPIRSLSPTPATLYEHRAVIHIFAAMAMNTPDRRAP